MRKIVVAALIVAAMMAQPTLAATFIDFASFEAATPGLTTARFNGPGPGTGAFAPVPGPSYTVDGLVLAGSPDNQSTISGLTTGSAAISMVTDTSSIRMRQVLLRSRYPAPRTPSASTT